MPLDATPGSATADSYATVEEADAYHSARGHNAAWTGASVAEKERHLKWASRLLDTHYTYVGARASAAQALAWPRRGAVLDGCAVASTSVPLQLKGAVAEYAFRLLQEDWTAGLGPVVDEGVQVGPLRTSPEKHMPVPATVAALVRPLVRGGAGGVRSVELLRG